MKRQRGIALMTVLILVMLVSTTILAMGILFASQARRTTRAPQAAQHEQLLLAGTQAVLSRLEAGGGPEKIVVKLPAEVDGPTLTCTPEPGPAAETVWYEIQVQGTGAGASQRVRFTKREQKWRVENAELGPSMTR